MTEHIPVRKRKGAETRARRTMTAKEGAARLGVSPRTIQRIIAEPREEFEARARQRRERAAELRASGLKYKEIAEEMDISIGMVGSLLHDARKHEARKSTKRGGGADAARFSGDVTWLHHPVAAWRIPGSGCVGGEVCTAVRWY